MLVIIEMSKKASEPSRREGSRTDEFLVDLGTHVRAVRAQHGMTRRILARDSDVSERYLAKLETGQGNVSISILRQIADAMDMNLIDILAVGDQLSPEMQELYQLARHLPADQLAIAISEIRKQLARSEHVAKARRISLIGLRGAGKSTLGTLLAENLGCEFVELNKCIEREFGAGLDEIFSLAGQPSFRRLERQCLTDIVANHDDIVIATGGSIVVDEQTFSMLLNRTHVVWVQAEPEEHMSRVVAQGDMRPMRGSREAMKDLKQILAARIPLYRRADAKCSTSGKSIAESLHNLKNVAKGLIAPE